MRDYPFDDIMHYIIDLGTGEYALIGVHHSVESFIDIMNRENRVIPIEILDKEPSAELRPDQKDSDSLPDYSILDKILFHYIEEKKGWKEIVKLGMNEELVRKIIRLVDKNEYKRFQASPTLRISHKAFGIGRQMPIVAKYDH